MNQVLTQDEINALLQGLSSGEIEGESAQDGEGGGIRKYDLTSQERIIRGRMATLEMIHERFVNYFRVAFASFLGKTCFASVASIEVIKFGAFIKKLPLPSSIHIYSMNPLPGSALLVFSSPFVFSLIDTLFGGKGTQKVKNEGKEYTEIELRLIQKVVHTVLDRLERAWEPVQPLNFTFQRSEHNPLAVGILAPSDIVIVVNVEIELEQETVTLTICTPYSTIEPIKQKLTTTVERPRPVESDENARRLISAGVRKADVNISVELATGSVMLRTIQNLKTGDVLQLETAATEPATILVEGIPKYLGYVGTSRGCRAVRVTEPVPEKS